jgi:serine/threonine protein kinase
VAIGEVLRERYRIRGVLGHGGMGTVYEAIDEYRLELPTAGRRIAIKVLHTAVTQRDELLSDLQREFQHLQLLSHPNIVRVFEFDRDHDIAFFTMELLTGELLSSVLNARNTPALPRPYALAIMRDVGAALSHAHARGIVHGDINPQNIFITNDGELRVLDFGASHRFVRDNWSADDDSAHRPPVATLGYASRQLLLGQNPDARDDVFAFACVAYLLLSGQHPFPNRTAIEASAQRIRPRRPARLTGPQWRVLREGLRWERDRRPSDIQKWLDRFDLAGAAPRLPTLPVLTNTAPPRKRRVVLGTAFILMFALLATAGYWALTDYDSLMRHIAEWSGQARSTLESAGLLPAATAPEVADQTPPPVPQAASPAPHSQAIRPTQSSQAAPPATRTAPALRAKPTPAPAPAVPPKAALGPPAAVHPARETRAGETGPVRIEMAGDTVDVPNGEMTAQVIVRRRGSLRGDVSFTWWTESGTAKPTRDFAPVMPRVEHIEDGSGSVSLTIPLAGTARTQAKSFYVVIDRTDTGAALGARTLTMVTLQPPD